MKSKQSFCPHWSWWLRSGDQITIGLDIRKILDGRAAGVSRQDQLGLSNCFSAVDAGNSLVDSLRNAQCKLPDEAWCLLESGERTGRLGEAMGEVGNLLRQNQDRRRELIGQLWYPVVVLFTGFFVMLVILAWVVPQMKEISLSMGQHGEIPWLTEHIGELYGTFFAFMAIGFSAVVILWRIIQLRGKASLSWAVFKENVANSLPLYRTLYLSCREARILRQIGTLLHGGITLPQALQLAAARSHDKFEWYQLEEFRKRLLMGISFEESLVACRIISVASRPLLLSGQESGRLDSYAIRIASDLDQDISWKLKQAIQIVEPLTIVGLAVMIAGLVLAYILPTISMLEQLA